MDWMFYGSAFVILFSAIAVILTVRYLMARRLERHEAQRRADDEARQISETNSGL